MTGGGPLPSEWTDLERDAWRAATVLLDEGRLRMARILMEAVADARAERALRMAFERAAAALELEREALERETITTRVPCLRCGLGIRPREAADGRCAECLRQERDGASRWAARWKELARKRAEASESTLWRSRDEWRERALVAQQRLRCARHWAARWREAARRFRPAVQSGGICGICHDLLVDSGDYDQAWVRRDTQHGCRRCGGTGVVYSGDLGRIQCPECAAGGEA